MSNHLFDSAVHWYQSGNLAAAADACNTMLTGRDDHPDALRLLGVIDRDLGRSDASLRRFDRALAAAPEHAEIWFERGCSWQQRGDFSEAAADFQRALALRPDFGEAAINLAVVLEESGKYEDALPWALSALRLKPDWSIAHYNAGNVYRALGDLQPAIAAYREALHLDPQNARAHWNLATCYLLLGDYGRGWSGHEWRDKAGEVAFDSYPQPRWDGSPLAGKTLLVHAEQGLGDEVLFASCYPDLIAAGAQCIFVCDPRLAPIFRRSFPLAQVYGYRRRRDGTPCPVAESIDWQIPAGSLPQYFRRTSSHFPMRDRFLWADQAVVETWRTRLAACGPGLKVGISWQAGGKPSERQRRTMRLHGWQRLFALPGIQWINLQYGDATAELETVRRELGCVVHDFAEGDPLVDLDAFAAKMAACDLVITVGNATAHLAGALGVDTWTLLPRVPGWRWQIKGRSTPWYPSLRLFRQQTVGSWHTELDSMRDALSQLVASRGIEHGISYVAVAETNAPAPVITMPAPAKSSPWSSGAIGAERFVDQDVPAALERAIHHHQAGELAEAEAIYREILRHLPCNIDSQRLLGHIAFSTGRIEMGITWLRRAIAVGDEMIDTRLQLAAALENSDRRDEARSVLAEATVQFPNSPELWLAQGQLLGRAMLPDAGLESIERAIALAPDCIDAYCAKAEILLADGMANDALQACDRALALDARRLPALRLRAQALHRLDRNLESALSLAEVANLLPADFDSQFGCAEAWREERRFTEAEGAYRRAIELCPNVAKCWNNLGMVLQAQGRLDEALNMYEHAIELEPEQPAANLNRGLAWLIQERACAGWYEYRWRFAAQNRRHPCSTIDLPIWDGSSLAEKSILVHAESSLEDQAFFARFLPQLAQRAERVVVACDERMARTLARSFPKLTVIGQRRGQDLPTTGPSFPPAQTQIALGDVPGLLCLEGPLPPSSSAVLIADPQRVEWWRCRLAGLGPGPKVGIIGRNGFSSGRSCDDHASSELWSPLLATSGVQFVELPSSDAQQAARRKRIPDPRVHALDDASLTENLEERLALLAALDLTIGHPDLDACLAGALGVPTWVILSRWPHWHWPWQGDQSAWFSSFRIWRQTAAGDWVEPIVAAREELLRWLARRAETHSMRAS